MYYADIKQYDVANGPGVRVSLFVIGCRHRCKDCFNPETWDFHYGAGCGRNIPKRTYGASPVMISSATFWARGEATRT